MSHSRIAPSAAPVWRFCPWSVLAQERYPEQADSEAAREGEAVHWVGAGALSRLANTASSYIGATAPNGVIITGEMALNTALYVDTVRRVEGELHIEEQIACTRIHPESFGTPDCWLFDPINFILYIWDYKNGYGIVEPFENWQFINYYSGILDLLPSGVEQDLAVKFIVVQPNPHHSAGPVREWSVPAGELRPYVNQLYNAAHEALSGEGRAVSGDHCKHCRARHSCLSAEQAAMTAVDVSHESPQPQELSADFVGIELAILERAIKALEYRKTGLEEQGLAMVAQGELVPGRQASSGRGRIAWDEPITEVLALGDMLGVDLRKPETALTPKQAEVKGLDPELIAAYSSAPASKLKLISNKKAVATSIFGR